MPEYIYEDYEDFIAIQKCIKHMEDNFCETIFYREENTKDKNKLYEWLCKDALYSKKTFIAVGHCNSCDSKAPNGFQKILEELIIQLLMLETDCLSEWQLLIRKDIGVHLNGLFHFVPLSQILIQDANNTPDNFSNNRSSRELIIKKFLNCFQKKNCSLILFLKDAHKADYETARFISELITEFHYNKLLMIINLDKNTYDSPLAKKLKYIYTPEAVHVASNIHKRNSKSIYEESLVYEKSLIIKKTLSILSYNDLKNDDFNNYINNTIQQCLNNSFHTTLSYLLVIKMHVLYCSGRPLYEVFTVCEPYGCNVYQLTTEPLITCKNLYKKHMDFLEYGNVCYMSKSSLISYKRNGLMMVYYLRKAEQYYFSSLYYEAEMMLTKAKSYLGYDIPVQGCIDLKLYFGLVQAKLYPYKETEEKINIHYHILTIIKYFEILSERGSNLYQGLLHIMLGELYKIRIQYQDSIYHYQKAIEIMSPFNRCQYLAVAHELCGELFCSINKIEDMLFQFQKASNSYKLWGCFIKVYELNKKIKNHQGNLRVNIVNEQSSLDVYIKCIMRKFFICRFTVYYKNQKQFTLLMNENHSKKNNYPISHFRACCRIGRPVKYNLNLKHLYKDDAYYSCNIIEESCSFPISHNKQTLGIIYIEYENAKSNDSKELLHQLEFLSFKIIHSDKWLSMENQLLESIINPLLAKLTKREKEVMKYAVIGKTNKEITKLLWISENTVKTHMKSIFRKLKISKRIQLSSFVNKSVISFGPNEISP